MDEKLYKQTSHDDIDQIYFLIGIDQIYYSVKLLDSAFVPLYTPVLAVQIIFI